MIFSSKNPYFCENNFMYEVIYIEISNLISGHLPLPKIIFVYPPLIPTALIFYIQALLFWKLFVFVQKIIVVNAIKMSSLKKLVDYGPHNMKKHFEIVLYLLET